MKLLTDPLSHSIIISEYSKKENVNKGSAWVIIIGSGRIAE